VPILTVSAVVYFSGRTILQKQTAESLTALNQAKAAQLDLFIEKLKVRTADWSSDGRIRKDAEQISLGRPMTDDLSLYLRDKKLPLDPAIVLADVLDVKGVVVGSSDTSRLGKNESREKISFFEAVAASFGEAVFTPELVVEEDELGGAPMLHLAAPLTSIETGKTVGVLLLHIKNDELNKVVAVKERKTLETYLVSREKLMITPSRFVPAAVLSQSVDTPPARACFDRNKDYRGSHLNYRGEPVFGVSVCLPGSLGVMITEIDASEALASLNVFRNTAAAALAVVLAAAVIFAFFAGKTLLPQATTTTTTTTTIVVIGIIIGIGVVLSLFMAKTVEQFVWRVKTEAVPDVVQAQAKRHLGDASQQRLMDFVAELKTSLPPVAAVKIYNKEAVLIWSDLAVYKKELGKKHEEDDVQETLSKGQLVKSVEAEIKKQMGMANLLEIYVPVTDGVVEVYFDTSDLTAFVGRLQLFIWGLLGAALVVIYSLLHFVFHRQNAQIGRQAGALKNIIDNSPLGIYTLNRDGVIDAVNPAMVRMSGARDAREVIGMNALEMPTYTAVGLDKFFREGLAGKRFEIEKDNRHYFGVPVLGIDGEAVERLLLMVEDITERKRLEKEVEEYTQELEQKVAQRTAELDKRIAELERMNKLMVGRELKMAELKKELKELKGKI